MIWTPHATVACIVERGEKFLFVEEHSNNKRVFNQPAGHVEKDESVFDAAIRETLEETGWTIVLTGFVGFYVYTAPENGVTYHRYCFVGRPIEHTHTELDKGIVAAHWLSIDDLKVRKDHLRSPLVWKCLEDYLSRPKLPLDIIHEHQA